LKHLPTFTRIAGALRNPLLTTGVVVGIGLIVLVYKLPQWQIEATPFPPTGKERIEAENNTRDIIIKSFGGIFFLVTAYLSWCNLQTAEKNYQISEDKQITERFGKAVEQLSDKARLEVRLGGIYSLERIAKDSPQDHWVIMEVLTAFVREKSPVSIEAVEQQEQSEDGDNPSTQMAKQRNPPTDIQAALTVIGRRKTEQDPEGLWIDLSETNLEGANLDGAQLDGAQLTEANLCKANLTEANLYRANLDGAGLTGAGLAGANLDGAGLTGANLDGANLEDAQLKWARLGWASLYRANLDGANLAKANLEAANLTEANLEVANLDGANLAETDLDGASLFGAQLDGANLFKASLRGINLHCVDLSKAKSLRVDQVKQAQNWEKAIYDESFRKKLGLLPEASKEESNEK
jgi:uncharacterized protein YjbI with pentapeptide repeats